MSQPTQSPDSVPDRLPDDLATPEGDNEVIPSAPPLPAGEGLERPRGNEPHPSLPLRKAED